ncbi:hypothetical protein FRC11_007950 [Ceratobasidium sp. 423]|nr:hypothetical protein FRC11_007950 [Ceratobasidium sp. 423]
MPKRSNNASNNSRSDKVDASQKRVKTEGTDAKIEPASPTSSLGLNAQPPPSNNPIGFPQRDLYYYFEDGSIIFQVKNVLFKVHASLLERRSDDFKGAFNVPPAIITPLQSRGNYGEGPIIIPDVPCYQFRHLMKAIYIQPTDHFFSPPPAKYKDVKNAARDFVFYADVARLSLKFAMKDTETWAKQRLAKLVHMPGKALNDGFEVLNYQDIGRSYDDVANQVDHQFPTPNPANYEEFSIIEAIRYARDISDAPLLHDALNLMQYYCADENPDVTFVLALLRIPNLCDTEPSLFGFLFLLVLSTGNTRWMDNMFTQVDRMALFSAQSLLSPVPDSLKAPSETPLFNAPTLEFFTERLSDETVRQSCIEQCYPKALSDWQEVFGRYYEDLADRDLRVPIDTLTSLPINRKHFSNRLQKNACADGCYRVILAKIDQVIQDFYAQVAKYYKPID